MNKYYFLVIIIIIGIKSNKILSNKISNEHNKYHFYNETIYPNLSISLHLNTIKINTPHILNIRINAINNDNLNVIFSKKNNIKIIQNFRDQIILCNSTICNISEIFIPNYQNCSIEIKNTNSVIIQITGTIKFKQFEISVPISSSMISMYIVISLLIVIIIIFIIVCIINCSKNYFYLKKTNQKFRIEDLFA